MRNTYTTTEIITLFAVAVAASYFFGRSQSKVVYRERVIERKPEWVERRIREEFMESTNSVV